MDQRSAPFDNLGLSLSNTRTKELDLGVRGGAVVMEKC